MRLASLIKDMVSRLPVRTVKLCSQVCQLHEGNSEMSINIPREVPFTLSHFTVSGNVLFIVNYM